MQRCVKAPLQALTPAGHGSHKLAQPAHLLSASDS
jgi:hypothetical protein